MADSGRPTGLTSKQKRAISALMTSPTIAAAAKAAGCGERTLYRWLGDPVFTAELQAAERQALDATMRRLTSLSVAATSVVAHLLGDDDVPSATKARAADIVFGRMLQWREVMQLEERLAALEAALSVGRIT